MGILRWIVELGQIDICGEVSMLAAFTAAPQEGHIQTMIHMFSYLAQHE